MKFLGWARVKKASGLNLSSKFEGNLDHWQLRWLKGYTLLRQGKYMVFESPELDPLVPKIAPKDQKRDVTHTELREGQMLVGYIFGGSRWNGSYHDCRYTKLPTYALVVPKRLKAFRALVREQPTRVDPVVARLRARQLVRLGD